MNLPNPVELSIEFFPPQTAEGVARLRATRTQLAVLRPDYFSVTYGAGGTMKARTFDTVQEIIGEGHKAAPHLTCIGASRAEICEIIHAYREAGICRIVALRGDPPSGMGNLGELRYASELVDLIRTETGDHFKVEVAAYPECHPQADSPEADLHYFAQKMAAGADSAITQYFFNPDAYFYFVDAARKLGVEAPVVPGIMPILNYGRLARFSENCGSEIPRWMRKRFDQLHDDVEAVRELGIELVTALCERLLQGGAPGLHFYCMNQPGPTLEICRRLGFLGPLDA